MRNAKKAAALVLCAAMLAGGCAQPESQQEETKQTEDKEHKAPKEKKYQAKLNAIQPAAYNNANGLELEKGSYISIIGKSKDGQYWEEVEKGVLQAAADINEELGYEGKNKVKVTFSAPSEKDNVDEQVNILDEELARYPVALGIAIADEQACSVQFDLAAEMGIPVVAFDSGSEYQGILATISTDNAATGKVVADQMAEKMEQAGEVLIFAHDSKSKASRQRIQGFQEQLAASYPNMTIVDTYYMDKLEEMQKTVAAEINAGTWTKAETESNEEVMPESITEEDVADYVLAKHPNIKGIYGTNSDAVLLAVDSLGRQKAMENVTVMGYDGAEKELAALEEGKVDGLLVQNPFGMGYASVIAAARASLNLGNEAVVNTGYTWVTKENMKEAEIKKMLY